MKPIPSQTLTILMTDVEGSTALWEADRDLMGAAIARHDAIAEAVVASHAGRILKDRGEGDSVFAVFHNARDAVLAAQGLQDALAEEPWHSGYELRIRAAVHTGETFERGGDLYGPTVNRCARIRAAGHGGQTLVSHATQQLAQGVLGPDLSLVDLGEHRLKDLLLPERIFDLRRAGAAAAFPPLRTLNVLPHNLPLQLTSFVGRTRVLAELRSMLSAHRLLTLTGSGGYGKTRLGLHLAVEAGDGFRDGVWLVKLAGIQPGADILNVVRATLAVPDDSGEDGVGGLVRHLEQQQLLLLLDNCEHVADSAAELAATLLQSCPLVKVLTTSRARLGVVGEATFPVPPLDVPPAGLDDPERLLDVESVRLFRERAIEREPSFEIDTRNAVAVAALCRRLDGLPLALELVASTVGVLSPGEILDRWDEDMLLIRSDDRTPVPRHQTLRASLDWSYALISEGAKTLLARLAVFSGGWSLESAEAVVVGDGLSRPEVFNLMRELASCSLVVTETTDSGAKRFRFLEATRHYAEELADTTPEMERAYLAYFESLVERAEPHLAAAEQVQWLEALDADRGNLRACFDRLMLESAERALLFTQRLRRFWIRRGPLAEGREWLVRSLGAAKDASDVLRAESLISLGALCSLQGDYRSARSSYEESLELCRRIGDASHTAAVLANLGIVASQEQDHENSIALLAESCELYRSQGDRNGEARALLNLGTTYIEAQIFADGESCLTRCLSLLEEPSWIAACHMNRARAFHGLDRLDEALADVREALAIQREVLDPKDSALLLTLVAAIACDLDRTPEALAMLGAAEGLAHSAGTHLWTESVRRVEDASRDMASNKVAAIKASAKGMTLRECISKASDLCAGLTTRNETH